MTTRVLLDVDGVLADFVGRVCRTLHYHGVKPDDIAHLDLSLCLTPQQFAELESTCHWPGFCSSIDWYPDAQKFVNDVQGFAEVYAVTSPWKCGTWCAERMVWLEQAIPRSRVVFTESKYVVQGDILVEDSPNQLRAWKMAHPNGMAILINRPWNKNSIVAGAYYCDTLDAAYKLIRDRHDLHHHLV